ASAVGWPLVKRGLFLFSRARYAFMFRAAPLVACHCSSLPLPGRHAATGSRENERAMNTLFVRGGGGGSGGGVPRRVVLVNRGVRCHEGVYGVYTLFCEDCRICKCAHGNIERRAQSSSGIRPHPVCMYV
ncbi:unnamed protein product, partial [Scytosiphon promiscuus]